MKQLYIQIENMFAIDGMWYLVVGGELDHTALLPLAESTSDPPTCIYIAHRLRFI